MSIIIEEALKELQSENVNEDMGFPLRITTPGYSAESLSAVNDVEDYAQGLFLAVQDMYYTDSNDESSDEDKIGAREEAKFRYDQLCKCVAKIGKLFEV